MKNLITILCLCSIIFSLKDQSDNFVTEDFSGEWKVSGVSNNRPLSENITYIFDINNKDFFKENNWKYYNDENLFYCKDCDEYENNHLIKSNSFVLIPPEDSNHYGYWSVVSDTLFLYGVDEGYDDKEIEILTPEKPIFRFIDNNLIELNYFVQEERYVDKGVIFFKRVSNEKNHSGTESIEVQEN